MDTSNHHIDMLFGHIDEGNNQENNSTTAATNNVTIKQEEVEDFGYIVPHREIADSNSQHQNDNFGDNFVTEVLASGGTLNLPHQQHLPPTAFPIPGLPLFVPPPNSTTNIPPLPNANPPLLPNPSIDDLSFSNPEAHALFLSNSLSAGLPFFPSGMPGVPVPLPPLFNPLAPLGPPPPLLGGMPPPELFAAFPHVGGAPWNPLLQQQFTTPIPPKPVPSAVQQTKSDSKNQIEEDKKKKEEVTLIHDQKQEWITEILSENPILQQAKIEVHIRTRSERHNSIHETNVYEKMYSSLIYIVKQYVTLPNHEIPVIFMKVKVIDYTSPLQQPPTPLSISSKVSQIAPPTQTPAVTEPSSTQGNSTVIVLPDAKPGSVTAPQVTSSMNIINSINNGSSSNSSSNIVQSSYDIMTKFMDKESLEKLAHQITLSNKTKGLNKVVKPEELASIIMMTAIANSTDSTSNTATSSSTTTTNSVTTGTTTNQNISTTAPSNTSNLGNAKPSTTQTPSATATNLTTGPYNISQSGNFVPSSYVILGLLKSCRTLEDKIQLLQSFKTNSEIKGKIVSQLVPTVEVVKEPRSATSSQTPTSTENPNLAFPPLMFPFMTPTPPTPAPIPTPNPPPIVNPIQPKDKNGSVTYTSESKIQFSEVSYRQFCAFQFLYYLDEKCETPVLCHISPPFQIFARKQNEKEGYSNLSVNTNSSSSSTSTTTPTSPKPSKKRSATASESSSNKKAKNGETTTEVSTKQNATTITSASVDTNNTTTNQDKNVSNSNKNKTARLEPAVLTSFKEKLIQHALLKCKSEEEEEENETDFDDLFDKPKKDQASLEQFSIELDSLIKQFDTTEENGLSRKTNAKEKKEAIRQSFVKFFDLHSNNSE